MTVLQFIFDLPGKKGALMYWHRLSHFAAVASILFSFFAPLLANVRATRPARQIPSSSTPPRDEKLWKRALEIHRKAIVIDTHNDITTPMTNDDYDLGGAPPVPYRTSIERMKQGGMTAEFFSLYVKP